MQGEEEEKKKKVLYVFSREREKRQKMNTQGHTVWGLLGRREDDQGSEK